MLVDLSAGPAPLAANLEEVDRVAVLGRDGVRVADDVEDLWVESDVEVLLLNKPLVTFVDSRPDPLGEVHADHGVADVDDPLES